MERMTGKVGTIVEAAGMKWIILDKLPEGYFALSAESIGNKRFGNNNDWRDSKLREYLNSEFAEKIEKEIETALPEFERNLLSLDGQIEYDTCMNKVSLITIDEYRKYRQYIPNAGYYWWTCTSDSTKSNGDGYWLAVVSPSGNINNNSYNNDNGVRPSWITGSRSRQEAETSKDTEKRTTFLLEVNTKVYIWTKILFVILTTCIKLIKRQKQVKALVAALHAFR